MSTQGDELEPISAAGRFTAANGIALSTEGSKLYVADFGDGISVVDLSSGSVHPIGQPPGLCLATIDGLYFYRGTLVAIQNGYMSPRVVQFSLTTDGNRIQHARVLERRNPLFDGVTTGVIAGDEFYYIANNQIDKVHDGRIVPGVHLNPITILKLHLRHR
jgi:DNA-binding beta-propeller fold protein YncE